VFASSAEWYRRLSELERVASAIEEMSPWAFTSDVVDRIAWSLDGFGSTISDVGGLQIGPLFMDIQPRTGRELPAYWRSFADVLRGPQGATDRLEDLDQARAAIYAAIGRSTLLEEAGLRIPRANVEQELREDASAATPEDRLVQLTKLAELHSAGVLTDAEFDAEKARVLGQRD
jgi:hypothetical protein